MQLEWDVLENKDFDEKIIGVVGSKIIAQILANRGIDTLEKANAFLNPSTYPLSDYNNFLDMQKAVDRIKTAIEKEQNIVICGDFDCDGVTSTAVLYRTLDKIGAKVCSYIPNRQSENHGLNSKAIIEIISRKKAKLIITVDNGISNAAEIKLAQSFGVDVIVTDHHEPPQELPPAFAIINPKCSDKVLETLEFQEMSNMVNFAGVLVAYKLACALLDEFGYSDFKKELLVYVMLGTISDVMPLTMENRAIVTLGLEQLKANIPQWLKKMFELAQKNPEQISSETMAFIVAPRINAAGRLEQATTALDLLVSDDEEKINFCANQLQQYNQTRQQMCDTSFNEASVRISNEINLKSTKAIVLADEKWHIGIVGLLASRIVETYNRAAFVMSIDKEENKARCSIRGIKGLSIHKVLTELQDCFEAFGGHELAGGFGVDLNKISIKQLARQINEVVTQQLANNDLKKKMSIDYILEPEDLTVDFVEKLSVLEPYGEGNRSCVFGMENLNLKKFEVIGNNAHLKMLFEAENGMVFESLIWNKNEHKVNVLDKVDLTFVPKINEYKGKKTVQLIVKNIYIKNRKIETEDFSFDENVVEPAILVDHRKKKDFLKMLNGYIGSNNVNVFLEDRDFSLKLNDYSSIKSALINRFEVAPNEELILLSAPCNEEDFAAIIKKSNSKKVHIFNCDEKNLEVNDFIKTLSGMLKYCAKNANGKIEIPKSLAYLSVTKEAFALCCSLLEDCNVIKILDKEEDFYQFEFIESQPLSAFLAQDKYALLQEELDKINSFKNDFKTCDFAQIKEMVEV